MLERPQVPQNVEQPQTLLDVLRGLFMYSQIGREPIIMGMPGMVRGGNIFPGGVNPASHMLKQGDASALPEALRYRIQAGRPSVTSREPLQSYGNLVRDSQESGFPHTVANPLSFGNQIGQPLAPVQGGTEAQTLLQILLQALRWSSIQ